jgi:hypothetical protein
MAGTVLEPEARETGEKQGHGPVSKRVEEAQSKIWQPGVGA